MATLARSSPQALEARARTEAALLAAAEVLVQEGRAYADIAVAEIARQAGVSRATFYAYFPDKRALALRLERQLADVLALQASGWFEGNGDVRGALASVLDVFEEHRGAVKLLTEAASYDAQVAALWQEVHDRFCAATAAQLAERIPGLSKGQVAARAFVLVWGTESSFTQHLQAPHADRSDLLDALELMWNGLSEVKAAPAA